ncbi:hypothetical protein ABC977_00060 [Thioalkalicoccus limnaeus]|uniref:Sucrose phosphatase-like domain-containing protein n=1 Tax=Thioalkalicoccus limnaeus TaxID=120681 RepID=A0ABV4BBT8_9GAMM
MLPAETVTWLDGRTSVTGDHPGDFPSSLDPAPAMPPPNAYLFVDLDDSLLQTREKCPTGPLTLAAHDRDGQPLSFHTPAQATLLGLLEGVPLIPVTGRNLTALRRVVSPRFASYRITSHGALVLGPDERPLPSWETQIDAQAAVWGPRLSAVAAVAEDAIREAGVAVRARVIEDLGFPVYLSLKGPEADLLALAERLAPHWPDGRLHHNHHNLALLPPYADKAAAVRHLIDAITSISPVPPLFIGLGDSLTDLPFLRLCNFALVPRDSQIQRHTWR